VLRAARVVVKYDPDWVMQASESQGGTMTFYNWASGRSRALASIIGSYGTVYRSPRRIARNDQIPWYKLSFDDLRAEGSRGGHRIPRPPA
jgi:hypothetical protein